MGRLCLRISRNPPDFERPIARNGKAYVRFVNGGGIFPSLKRGLRSRKMGSRQLSRSDDAHTQMSNGKTFREQSLDGVTSHSPKTHSSFNVLLCTTLPK